MGKISRITVSSLRVYVPLTHTIQCIYYIHVYVVGNIVFYFIFFSRETRNGKLGPYTVSVIASRAIIGQQLN